MINILFLGALGVLFDGLTTSLALSMGADEWNPVVESIGLGWSLIIRVAVIIQLLIIINHANQREQRKIKSLLFVFMLSMWMPTILLVASFINWFTV